MTGTTRRSGTSVGCRLCELELLDREQRATERRIKAAKFPVLKSFDTFEFRAIPSVNKRLVLELARSEYFDRRENVLALGNSGTGKTHLALALGLAACQKGYRVRFTTAAALVNELLEARDDKPLKDAVIRMRVSVTQKRAVKDAAERQGLEVSAWLRQLALADDDGTRARGIGPFLSFP